MSNFKFVSKKTIQKILIILSIVLIVGGSLTFAMTYKNKGFGDGFILSWFSSFMFCVLCIAPLGGGISLLLNKFINSWFNRLSEISRNLIFGMGMAIIMESIMAVVTTLNLQGFVEPEKFIKLWFDLVLTALPIGMVFSIIITLLVKPKLALFWAK